ncbi:amidohydrolase family protein [Candidatus Bathyarchaeota archaeon]|nr:amidohydrolase family protein [Candidatus Bathyarchaeota archaeon]
MSVLKDAPTTLMFHAEKDCHPSSSSPSPQLALQSTSYTSFLSSRPSTFETSALTEILTRAHLAPNLPLHIVHLSATECIPMLRSARAAGIKVTAETCFHYLELRSEDIPDGDTRHKCCPPIREGKNQEALWAELARPDSCIQTVVSDHSPCTPELKVLPARLAPREDFVDSGFSSPRIEEEPLASLNAKSAIPAHLQAGGLGSPDSGIGMSPGLNASAPPSRIELPISKLEQPRASLATPDSGIEITPTETPNLEKVTAELSLPGDFFAAWGGIASVGLGLPILHTASEARGLTILDIVRLCCQATAQQVGLSHRKGGLRVGMDADVCVFDDAEEWMLTPGEMRWKNKCSPWEGRTFRGRVKETWVGGRRVWDGRDMVGMPSGELLLEKRFA